jgi:hypothetical protein
MPIRKQQDSSDSFRKSKASVRLKPVEQVRDRIKTTGFAGAVPTYDASSTYSVDTLRNLMLATVWAETCINTIVDEVVKYPLYTQPMNPEIEAFLKYPSEKEPLFLIRKKYLKDMLRWGNGACTVELKNKKPQGLVVVPGYTLRMTDDNPPKYKFLKINSSSEFQKKGDTDIVLTDKEVMHFQIDADSDSTLARSPLERCYYELNADRDCSKKLAQFIQRGFYKPFFLSFEKGVAINKGDLQEFIEYLNGLVEEGAKALGINKSIKFSEIPFLTTKEIIDLQQWIGLKVASVFKVPPFMLNLVQDTGSLNAREQKARFLENVVLPILEYEAFMYTMVIARKGFQAVDTDVTSLMMGTKLNYDRARIARLLAGSTMEILTQDEIREMFFNLGPINSKKNTNNK